MENNRGNDINILFCKLNKVGIKLPEGLDPTVSSLIYNVKKLITSNVAEEFEERKKNYCLKLLSVLDVVVINYLRNGCNEASTLDNEFASQVGRDHLQEHIKSTYQNVLPQSEGLCINNDQEDRLPAKRFKFVESLLKSSNLNLPGNILSKNSDRSPIRANPWSYTTYLLKKYLNSKNSQVSLDCEISDSVPRFCNSLKLNSEISSNSPQKFRQKDLNTGKDFYNRLSELPMRNKTSYGSRNVFCGLNSDEMRKVRKDEKNNYSKINGNTALNIDNHKERTEKIRKRSFNTTPPRFSCVLSPKAKPRTKNRSNIENYGDQETSRYNCDLQESKNSPKTVKSLKVDMNKINHDDHRTAQRKRKNRTLDSAEISLSLRQRAKRFKCITTPKDLKNINRTSKKTDNSGGCNSDSVANYTGMSNDFSAFTNVTTPTSTMSNRFGKMRVFYRRNLFGVRKVKR